MLHIVELVDKVDALLLHHLAIGRIVALFGYRADANKVFVVPVGRVPHQRHAQHNFHRHQHRAQAHREEAHIQVRLFEHKGLIVWRPKGEQKVPKTDASLGQPDPGAYVVRAVQEDAGRGALLNTEDVFAKHVGEIVVHGRVDLVEPIDKGVLDTVPSDSHMTMSVKNGAKE